MQAQNVDRTGGSPGRPMQFKGYLLAGCWAVHICVRAYYKGKVGNLTGQEDVRSDQDMGRLLEESGNSTETCEVSPIADPFGEYFQEWFDVFLYLFGMFYLFFGLGYVCEEFFVCSIEKIILEFSIPPDVAGATLMAAGSSSPELFAELVGTFVSKENSAGTGTVVGSAIFNQLIIVGGALILCPTASVELQPLPLIRDVGFYILSIVWLFIAFEDGEIAQWEAWGLFLSYMLYVVVNAFWSRIMACSFVKNFSDSVGGGDLSLYVEGERQSKGEIMEHGNLTEELLVDNYINDLDKPDVDHRSVGDGGGGRSKSNASTGLVRSRYENDGSFSWQEDELTDSLSQGERGSFNPVNEHTNVGCFGKFIHKVTYPLVFIINCLLVDCRKYPKYYWVTFFSSIILLGGIVFFIIQWVEKAGCLIGFGSALMGLTVGAGGTSAPDALVSFHVARNGLGDMAVSNAFGSNVFDILCCLGLPWVIATTGLGRVVEVETEDFKNTFLILVGVLCIFIFNVVISWCRNGKIILFKSTGYIYIAMYLGFVIFSVIYCEILNPDEDDAGDDVDNPM